MTPSSGRLIAVGDVHGCVHALEILLESIQPVSADTMVFLGDLIDQGRDSAAVLDRLLELKQQCQVILIQGNHEELLFSARESERALRYWEECGGMSTLNSYRFGAGLDVIPDSHWAVLKTCQPFFETDSFIFTHAGYDPELPMSEQPDYQLRWEVLVPDMMRPHYSGRTVFVGHTEQENSEINDLGFVVCIDTACWRYGWLTALDVNSRECWQASRWGLLREAEEPTHRGRLPQLAPVTAEV